MTRADSKGLTSDPLIEREHRISSCRSEQQLVGGGKVAVNDPLVVSIMVEYDEKKTVKQTDTHRVSADCSCNAGPLF